MLYGTAWKQERTTSLCVAAVLSGFTGIDTACQPKHYRQELVGDALSILDKEHGINRESLWIQTKFTSLDGQDRSKSLPYDSSASLADQVRQSFATSLRQLRTTYVDSLVMHSPMQTRKETLEVWKEFEYLFRQGKVRQLGISNIYDPALLEWAMNTFEVKPSVIQNRFTLEHNQFALPILTLCQQHSATFQSFWTLTGNPWILQNPLLRELASSQALSPEQAWFAFLLNTERFGRGRITPLSGTTSQEHMIQDLHVVKTARGVGQRRIQELEREVEDILWGSS